MSKILLILLLCLTAFLPRLVMKEIGRNSASSKSTNCSELVFKIIKYSNTEEIHNQLRTSKIIDIKEIRGAHATDAYLLQFENGIAGVFKPQLKGNKLSNSYSEEMAYLLDRRFGFDLVPPTVIRRDVVIEGEVKWGSLQLYAGNLKSISEVINEKYPSVTNLLKKFDSRLEAFDKTTSGIYTKEINRIMFFNHIIDNGDPSIRNILVLDNGKLVSIDNGASFTGARSNESLIFSWYQKRFDSFLETTKGKEIFRQFKKLDQREFYNSLLTHLSEDNARSMIIRINDIIFREKYKKQFRIGLDYERSTFEELIRLLVKKRDFETLDKIASAVKIDKYVYEDFQDIIIRTMERNDVEILIKRLEEQERFKTGYFIDHFKSQSKWILEKRAKTVQ